VRLNSHQSFDRYLGLQRWIKISYEKGIKLIGREKKTLSNDCNGHQFYAGAIYRAGSKYQEFQCIVPIAFWGSAPIIPVRMKASIHAMDDYHPLSIPIPIHLFSAMDEDEGDDATPAGDTYLGWARVLPQAQIRVISVPGTHYSMMSPPHIDVLGKSLTDVMRQAGAVKKAIPTQHDACLVTIQVGQGVMYPVFCVPGAGANITDFIHVAPALGGQWPIHGLQPRGLNNGRVPHSTVPAAARAYLRVIDETYPEGPLHLLGHSFGGWVVFEMALRLRAAGRKVASVTLIDAEAPEGDSILGREYDRAEMFIMDPEIRTDG
jgi:thioesterase domain-containing protein